MQLSYQQKQTLLLILFLGFLAFSLFSPIASNDYVPNSTDFTNHIVNIIQARQGLEEGQFPVRVAPSIYHGWRYPYYQFYAPFVYTIGGAVYKLITPDNPFIAFKILLWIALVVGGLYIFRLVKEFVYADSAALLAAAAYLFAPYLIVDIGARGDLTESIAACLVPVALYYTIRCQRWPSAKVFLCTAIAWFILATTHILIFICTALFAGLFSIIYNICESLPIGRLVNLGAAFMLGCVLALWYFVPAITLQPYLYAHYILSNPFYYKWLSPLATLFSPNSVSPMPLPGNNRLHFPFYVSIGWPMLVAVGFILYKKIQEPFQQIPCFVTILLALFFLGVLVVWTPINFWAVLPEYFKAIQFSCRFLIQIMWIGAILFAWAVAALFQNKLDARHVVIGVLFIAVANGAWLQTNQNGSRFVAAIVQKPQLDEWGAYSFVVSSAYPHEQSLDPLLPVNESEKLCQHKKTTVHCVATVKDNTQMQLPILFYPSMLEIKVDGQSVPYQPTAWQTSGKQTLYSINPMLASIQLSPGTHTITARFVGVRWANKISMIAWVIVLLWAAYLLINKRQKGLRTR